MNKSKKRQKDKKKQIIKREMEEGIKKIDIEEYKEQLEKKKEIEKKLKKYSESKSDDIKLTLHAFKRLKGMSDPRLKTVSSALSHPDKVKKKDGKKTQYKYFGKKGKAKVVMEENNGEKKIITIVSQNI